MGPRWRLRLVVAALVTGAVVAAVLVSTGRPSTSSSILRVAGRGSPEPAASTDHPATALSPTAGTGAGGAGASTGGASGVVVGVSAPARVSSATDPPVSSHRHGPATSDAVAGSLSQSQPSPPPRPGGLPQPPGLGARLIPGLPPVPPLPGQGRPSPPRPATGTTRYPSGSTGYDISWPQCGQSYPPKPYTVAVVGVNDGQAFTSNPCFDSEAAWAGSGINLYININSPQSADGSDQSGPAGRCAPGDNGCLAYNYGYQAAATSVSDASRQGVGSSTWWLDVETAGNCANQFPTNGNGYWSCSQSLNSATVQGAIDALRNDGRVAGVYSTHYQWGVITGGYVPSGGSPPNWIAGADPSQTGDWCSGSHDFGGGSPWLLQLAAPGAYDQDQAC